MKKSQQSGRRPPQDSAWIPARPKKRGAEPASLGEVLVGTQEQLAQRGGNAIRRDEWRGIVGARIAGRTRVGKLYRGILTVKVASSAWSNELSLLKSELIAKLRLAGHDISDLRFRVEEFTGPTPATRGGQNRALVQASVLPEELEASLRKVDDPNLRAAIREAASWSLSRNLRSKDA